MLLLDLNNTALQSRKTHDRRMRLDVDNVLRSCDSTRPIQSALRYVGRAEQPRGVGHLLKAAMAESQGAFLVPLWTNLSAR